MLSAIGYVEQRVVFVAGVAVISYMTNWLYVCFAAVGS